MDCVYFVQSGRLVKIGFSRDLESRLKTLRTASPRLQLIISIPATKAAESWLHDQFSEDRVNGEWFRFSDAIREFINDPIIPAFAPRMPKPKPAVTGKTIMEMRAQLKEIRESALRRMERNIARRSAPLLAELEQLTAFARTQKRRKITRRDVAA